jgi:hypothetical protein
VSRKAGTLQYFTIRATRTVSLGTKDGLPDNRPPLDEAILTVRLARNGCQLEAPDPDLQTGAVMNLIEEKARECRRVPLWSPRLVFAGPLPGPAEFWGSVIAAVCIGYLVLAGISIGFYFRGEPRQQLIPWPGSIAAGIPVALLLLGLIVMAARGRTILLTQTRARAPTFWQANRTAIAINVVTNVVVAGAFFLLGLVVAHG